MVESFSSFFEVILFLKFVFFGSFSSCKADVAACRGEIRIKLRVKSWFDLMQHLILKQWNAGTGFSQKKLTKESVFCYLALTDRGNWNASWCRRLSFFGSIRSTLGLTDPLLHPKLCSKIISFDLIGKCGDGWEGEVRLLKMWSSGRTDWADCERLVEHERKKGRLTLWQPAFTLPPFFNLLKFIMLWKTTMILATIASPPLCFIIYHCQSCWLPTVLLTARTMHCTRQGTKDKGYLHQSRNLESYMKNWLIRDLAESCIK